MKINYNISAAVANKNLLGIESKLSVSMERLSTGLKLNDAKDNPAGMAISNKMQAQINGLNRASKNASDGVSLIQIADGALQETTNILQRMRELSVQASNDATLTLEDKQAIQDEIVSLKAEVDRISTDTEYNSKSLLDGTLDTRVYTKNASRVNISDYVNPGKYELTMTSAATQAGPVSTGGGVDYTDTTAIGVGGILTINGNKVEVLDTDTYAQVYEKIRSGAEIGEAKAEINAAGAISFTATEYGQNSVLDFNFESQGLAGALGFDTTKLVLDTDTNTYGYKEADPVTGVLKAPTGTDAEVTLTRTTTGVGFSNTATVAVDGNKITITDIGGFTLSFLADTGYAKSTNPAVDGKIEFDVTEIGTMTLHIGANEDQNMKVRIPEISSKSLYIDKVDVTTVNGADNGVKSFDSAIAQTTAARSKLGAYENRLDYSTSSLDAFEENMTGAISRLTDVDMAEEMTNYTHQNVLNQAAISVLTQANDLPQQVLQILQ